jgi:hypothetical protein
MLEHLNSAPQKPARVYVPEPERLARYFWVKPSEKMVRLWCRAFADDVKFTEDYQPWVVANLSGILCVDEVYQGDLALLLAVDPAAPDGDRLVGYTLLSHTREVDQSMVKAFLKRLQAAGLEPDEVITDDSRLYPSVLAEVWPQAVHQLCLFHATRRVVHAVNDAVKQVRRSLPTPPPASRPTLLGSLRRTPPAADQHDADSSAIGGAWRGARWHRRGACPAPAHLVRSGNRAATRRQPRHRPRVAR